MFQRGQSLKWLRFFLILFLAVCINYVAHESAHFLLYKALGYSPVINWKHGYVYNYNAPGEDAKAVIFAPREAFIILLAGPLSTVLLAVGFTIVAIKHPNSFLFFAIAIMSAVGRFNMLVDGFESDEGKLTSILSDSLIGQWRMVGMAVPLAFWTISLILTTIIIYRQRFFRPTYWAIPLWFLTNLVLLMLLRLLTTTFL